MDTKAKLIKVGAQLFAERGFNGVSIRDLVGKANVNLGAITYHFGGKDQLFDAVIADRTRPIRENIERIATSDLSPKEKLSSLLRTHALQVLHNDPTIRILFREHMRRKRHLSEKTHELIRHRNKVIGDIIREGIADGSFQKCDVESTVWIFLSLLSPYMWRSKMPGRPRKGGMYSRAAVNKIVANALLIFFNGLSNGRTRNRKGRRS